MAPKAEKKMDQKEKQKTAEHKFTYTYLLFHSKKDKQEVTLQQT